MLAFAIITMMVTAVTESWNTGMQKAGRAIAKRELREAADTLFRRILYEKDAFRGGNTGSLETAYAEWTKMSGPEAERWDAYRYELSRPVELAAGAGEEGEESVFGDDNDDDDDDDNVNSSGSTEDGENAPIRVRRIVLKIFDIEDNETPLIVLATYQPYEGDPDDAR